MNEKAKIELLKKQIQVALEDYKRHIDDTEFLEGVSTVFVNRLATDSYHAKQDLRNMFRNSPAWDEELDALVINGTRTRDTDYEVVRSLAIDILSPAKKLDDERFNNDLVNVVRFFSSPDFSQGVRERYLESLNKLAPKAYAPGKKLSRVFKALCESLGIADNTAGSEFQKLYAQFADELASKKIGFKLFVSLNPAHFLTMSNPKEDNRGEMLTSCHSLNCMDHDYNNGCTGYARDKVTMIAFTVSDPENSETLNNRKTTRQLFMYKPGNGLLLQSRMYNTCGGTTGAQSESALYRDLIQREISECENATNLWVTSLYKSEENNYKPRIYRGEGFGGYLDWNYSEYAANISMRKDHKDSCYGFYVGTWGICLHCGDTISKSIYCDDCESYSGGGARCDDCDGHFEEMYLVCRREEERYVCEACRNDEYYPCSVCGDYHHSEDVVYTADEETLCGDCRIDRCVSCDDCGDLILEENATAVMGIYGDEILVCEGCLCDKYTKCRECGVWNHDSNLTDGCCEECMVD